MNSIRTHSILSLRKSLNLHPLIMSDSTYLEDLAEAIFDQIVTENFKDLTRAEEALVYEIACDRAYEGV